MLAIDARGAITEVNTAAEHFFEIGRSVLLRSRLADLLPFGSPVFELVADAIATQSTVNGYRLDVSTRAPASAGLSTPMSRRCP